MQQRLVRMQLFERSMRGEEVVPELISCLSGIRSDQVMGSVRD